MIKKKRYMYIMCSVHENKKWVFIDEDEKKRMNAAAVEQLRKVPKKATLIDGNTIDELKEMPSHSRDYLVMPVLRELWMTTMIDGHSVEASKELGLLVARALLQPLLQ